MKLIFYINLILYETSLGVVKFNTNKTFLRVVKVKTVFFLNGHCFLK